MAQLNSFDTTMAKMRTQKTEQETLQKKYLVHNKQQCQHIIDVFKHIKGSLKGNARIESINIHQSAVHLKISADNTRTLNSIANTIADKQFCKDISISSFEYKDKNRMLAVMQTNC